MKTGILIFELRVLTQYRSETLQHRSELLDKRDIIIDILENELGYKTNRTINGTYIVLDEK